MKHIVKKLGMVSLTASMVLGGLTSLPVHVNAKESIQAVASDNEGYTFISGVSSLSKDKNKVDLELVEGEKIRFTFLSNDLFRLYMAPVGEDFKEYPTPNSSDHKATITVASDDAFYEKNKVEPTVIENDTTIQIKTESLTLEINKENSIMKLTKADGEIVWEEAEPLRYKNGSTYQTLKTSEDEYYFGGGTQNGRFSHKGEVIEVKNTNNWVDKGVASPNPFYWSTKGYGVVRNTWKPGTYDFDSQGTSTITTKHNEQRYDAYYFVGDSPEQILEGYYDLTGSPAELPEYASYLGHLNCYNRDYWKEVPEGTSGAVKLGSKWYKESSNETDGSVKETLNGSAETTAEQIIQDHKDNDMPLGWFLPNDGYGCGYGQTTSLDGDVENLKEFADNAIDSGIHTGLWTQSNLWPVDENNPVKGDRDIYKEVEAGVVAVKTDVAWVGAGYSMALNGVSVAYDAITSKSGSKANIVSLDGWAGTQRYAGIWTGDQSGGQWEYIRFHIPTYVGTALSGQPNVGSDMDGIFGGKNPTIWTRDFQWKAFTTYMLDMDGWGSNQKSPWALGEDGTSINRSYLKLKAMLMPYNNTISHEATANKGLPMIRAMFLEEANKYTYSDKTQYQYMWGDNFVVAPIYQNTNADENGNDIRNEIYLPGTSDVWIDYFTGKQYEGGRIINNFDAPIWKLPLFVRNGAIIPMYAENNNPVAKSDTNTDGLDRSIRRAEFYPYGNTEFEVYEDDGITLGGAGSTTLLTSKVDGDVATLKANKTEGTYEGMIDERSNEFIVNVSQAPKGVTGNVAGKDVTFTSVDSKEAYDSATGNVYFYDENPSIFVKEFASEGSTYENTDETTAPKLYVKSTEKVSIHNYDYTVVVDGFANDQGLQKDELDESIAAPTNIQGEDITDVSFTATWDEVEGATGYDVEIFDGVYVDFPSAKYEATNLTYDTDYNLRVRARIGNRYSPWSEVATIRTNVDRYRNVVRDIDVTWEYGASWGDVKNAFDFDQGTMFHSTSAVTPEQMMVLDMGEAYTMDKFTYQPRMDNKGNGTVLRMDVYASLDGVTYEKVWDGNANDAWTYSTSMDDEDIKEIPLNNKKIRFLKLSVLESKGGMFSASELQPYKVEGTDGQLVGDVNNSGAVDENDLTFYENYIGLTTVDKDWEYVSNLGNFDGNDIIDASDLSFVSKQVGTPITKPAQGVDGKLMLMPSSTNIKKGDTVSVDVYGIGLKNVNAFSVEFAVDQSLLTIDKPGQPSVATLAMKNFSKIREHSDHSVDNYVVFSNVGQQELINGSTNVATFTFTANADFTWNQSLARAILVGQDLSKVDALVDDSQTPQLPDSVNVLDAEDFASITFSNDVKSNIPGDDLWQQSNWEELFFDGDTNGSLAEFKWFTGPTSIAEYVKVPLDMEFTLDKAQPVKQITVYNRKSSNGTIKKIQAKAYEGDKEYDLGIIENAESISKLTFAIPEKATSVDRIVITPLETAGIAEGVNVGEETNRMLSLYEIEMISDATVPATGIEFAEDALTSMYIGSTADISATVLPTTVSNGLYEITSSDPETVRVEKIPLANSYAYVLRAIKEGSVTLTATSVDGAFTATREVQVIPGVDTSEILKQIEVFDALAPQLYTTASYNSVKVFVDQAKELLANNPSQAEVNALTIQIVNAMKTLELIGSNEDQPSSTNLIDLSNATLFYETSFSSAEKEHGDLAFDGDINTYWHSNYGSGYTLPQYIVVDLGKEYTLEQVDMLARQNSKNGAISHYRVEVSTTTGDNLTIDDLDFYQVVEGRFATDKDGLIDRAIAKEIKFDQVKARYVKFIALESIGSSEDQANKYASIAELSIYGTAPVCYADLEQAISEVNTVVDAGNDGTYTTSSWSNLVDALALAKTVESDASIEEIQSALSILKIAQEGLDKVASKVALTTLETLVESCKENMNKNDVNATSSLSELLEKAETLLAQDDQETSSTKVLQVLFDIVDARTTNVNDASVVRDMLGLVVDVAKDEQAGTVQRAGSLSELIAEAEELLASSSEDTDTMMTLIGDIKVAVMGDEEVIDRAKLEETLALAKLISADYYTEESYDVLQKAIEQAETVLADEAKVQVSIEDAYKALYDAVENLEARVVLDTSALENEIALSETILATSEAYMPNSIAGLQAAVDQAKTVLASATQQTELDDATTALQTVRLQAKLKADTSALKSLIEQVKALNLSGYTESSVEGLQRALAYATSVLENTNATQTEVDTAVQGLQKAVNDLAAITPNPGGDGENNGSGTTPGGNTNTPGNDAGDVDSGDRTNTTSLYGLLTMALAGIALFGRKKFKDHKLDK